MQITVAVPGRFHGFNLAKQLQKRTHLYQLITTYPKFAVSKFGIDTSCVKSIWYLEALARLYRKLPSFATKNYNMQLWYMEQFDHAVLPFIDPELDLFVGWSDSSLWSIQRARSMGIPTVLQRSSSHRIYQSRILDEEYAYWGLKFTETHPGVYDRELQTYEEADTIEVPSLFVKQTFLDAGVPESKLLHLPYGASLQEFYPGQKEDSIFRVVHCGALSLRKGIPYLLQAFYELNLPEAELWLIGSLTPEIMPFLEKYKNDRVILKGTYPQSKLRLLYCQCSVFCIASIEEGLAMVQPQAMACGLPVIHTTNTGGSDVVRDGLDGYCVPIRDVEALKEKILFFYDNPTLREEMGSNALSHAQTALSWERYGDKTISSYQHLLKSKDYDH
ncbi:MAG: glycosyltransferase family 4 protein [Tildeniella nuda ZEHNDER 1965/U140]|jgi:glycosyltransferase involved in cell wall biosynthesis|nr:glycosyltransferase family 4 protein [Tildeniella nuda ZEHNDER 1965/U140]